MRFYRLHRTTEHGSSTGYEFFSAKKEAEKKAREWLSDFPHESAEVVPIEVKPTKDGILSALNREASHADNG